MTDKQIVIIGAGPAGLTAAYELTKLDHKPVVVEQLDKVGGIARTENYKGFHFDMGGHRFFTKAEDASQVWHQVLGKDLLLRPRLSRIYYNQRFFDYPLKPFNALFGLGIFQSILVVLSFIRWQLIPYKREDTFEQWVTNRFGRRLFKTFFKTYTEKVWGIPCSELRGEWAAQRIKNLSLQTAVVSMFLKPKTTITTLIEQFHYPSRGPGMLWEAVKAEIERRNGVVRLNTGVVKILTSGKRIDSVVVRNGKGEELISGTDFISSMPISEFVKKLDPVPAEVLQAAEKLSYRDFLTVCLIVDKPNLFPDNWIYVHDPEVKVGRIQNFKNWSPHMVPDASKTSLGLEYFCTEGDELWNMPDADLIELGKKEIERVGMASRADVVDGCVFRVAKAYPVYDANYRNYLGVIREFISSFENFQTIGRNGLHRYNNLDHAMITGIFAARNLALGENNDVWSVNTDQEYHEEVRDDMGMQPSDVAEAFQGALAHVFSRIDPIALGLSVGITVGILLFLATLALVLKGGVVIGPNLTLLDEFFPGYSVTLAGSFVGLAYGFIAGFVGGWALAFLRNATVLFNAILLHRQVQFQLLRRYLDYMWY